MTPTPPGLWVEEWLSQPRFARYLRECGGDRQRALDTYEWNIRLSHAVLRDTGHFEIALRNAHDRAISSRCGTAQLSGGTGPGRFGSRNGNGP